MGRKKLIESVFYQTVKNIKAQKQKNIKKKTEEKENVICNRFNCFYYFMYQGGL